MHYASTERNGSKVDSLERGTGNKRASVCRLLNQLFRFNILRINSLDDLVKWRRAARFLLFYFKMERLKLPKAVRNRPDTGKAKTRKSFVQAAALVGVCSMICTFSFFAGPPLTNVGRVRRVQIPPPEPTEEATEKVTVTPLVEKFYQLDSRSAYKVGMEDGLADARRFTSTRAQSTGDGQETSSTTSGLTAFQEQQNTLFDDIANQQQKIKPKVLMDYKRGWNAALESVIQEAGK
jgi:hypothetical protein